MEDSFDRTVSYNIFAMDPETLEQKIYWRYVLSQDHRITGDLEQVPEFVAIGRTEVVAAFPWATADGEPPPSTPQCGLLNQHCEWSYVNLVVILVGVIALICGLALIYFVGERARTVEKRVNFKSWDFRMNEVQVLVQSSNTRPTSEASSYRTGDTGSTTPAPRSESGLVHGVLHGGVELLGFIGQGRLGLHGKSKRSMALKQYRRADRFDVRLNSNRLALRNMMEVNHDNVTHLVGLSLDCSEHLLVGWEYCAKGSLHDLVFRRELHLDQVFKASIVRDVVYGLAYLHSSPIGVHGQLTLENCVVSGRWQVKLTDFGLQEVFREQRFSGDLTFKSPSLSEEREKLLHLAPELLLTWRPAIGLMTVPTKAADLYSLSLIVYQVLTRRRLYDTEELTEEEVKDKLLSGRLAGLRQEFPEVLPDDPDGELSRLVVPITRCSWQWDPESRPTIRNFQRVVSKVKASKHNIVEHMITVLENYAASLEAKVADKTALVAEEKKKSDDLLGRMLPESVMARLKRGEAQPPESYESVTVLFSDVAGFVDIAAASDPIQMVDLLNTLYGVLDELIQRFDAYKVETIGDSYMIVSGLPKRNGMEHVVEIARLAVAMRSTASRLRVPHLSNQTLSLRLGFHTGPCAAAVLGNTMPRFCLFGDTVNTASRMETTSESGKIQVSEASAKCLEEVASEGDFELAFRGTVQVKGKGQMPTFWLNPTA